MQHEKRNIYEHFRFCCKDGLESHDEKNDYSELAFVDIM